MTTAIRTFNISASVSALRKRRIIAAIAWGVPLIASVAAATPRAVYAQQISTEAVRQAETEAGNIVADAVRASAGAEVALVPAAAFKPGAAIPRPASGEQAVSLVSPASDAVVVLNLRGAQILAALERSVSFAPQPSAGFLQVSGLKFSYDASKNGGSRVTSVTLPSGAPLDAAKTYKVATTRPLALGQQGYFQVWTKSDIAGEAGSTLGAALADYAKARGGALTAPLDGRINRTDH